MDQEQLNSNILSALLTSDDHRYGKPAGLPGMGLAGAGAGDYI